MKRLLFDKKFIGIIWAVILAAVFMLLSLVAKDFLDGVLWYLFSSILRIIFGIIILFIGKKLYEKSAKEILSFSNSKIALISGLGFIVYLLYYIIDVSLGCNGITGLTVSLFLTRVILQQMATGFYEELNYRFLMLEGYFHGNRNVWRKLVYAFVGFVIFGLAHVLTGWDTYTFLLTGAIGFAFSVIYLNSGNIVIPMLLHFIYDIFANMSSYIEWNNSELFTTVNSVFDIVLVIMFIISFVLLIKNKEENTKKEKGIYE